MTSASPPLVAIVGPTATGKSTLGIQLAKRFSGEIVSADSRQVYKYMDIGTGKVTTAEQREVPHHLLSIVEPTASYTVVQYQHDAHAAIDAVLQRNNTPFLVGGSPLYVYAVTEGWQFPNVPPKPDRRRHLQQEDTEKLYQRLEQIDPERAERVGHHRRRLIRSLEIAEELGHVPQLQTQPRYRCCKLGIYFPRSQLHQRIEVRLDKRLAAGMLEEIQALYEQHGIPWEQIASFGLEYRWGARYLRGDIDYDTMREKLLRDIRRFARRQMQWFAKDEEIEWIEGEQHATSLVASFLEKKA